MKEDKEYFLTGEQFKELFKDKKFPIIVYGNIPFEFIGNEKVKKEIQKELDKIAEKICETFAKGLLKK